eukprot:COSAG04_NODE_2109_length_4768_cov_4.383380_2_plen_183_part_00
MRLANPKRITISGVANVAGSGPAVFVVFGQADIRFVRCIFRENVAAQSVRRRFLLFVYCVSLIGKVSGRRDLRAGTADAELESSGEHLPDEFCATTIGCRGRGLNRAAEHGLVPDRSGYRSYGSSRGHVYPDLAHRRRRRARHLRGSVRAGAAVFLDCCDEGISGVVPERSGVRQRLVRWPR